MKQRVMTRYFEDVYVMLTINLMSFIFRLVVGFALVYFTASNWNTAMVKNGAELFFNDPPEIFIMGLLILLGAVGLFLIVGLFTRKVAILSIVSHLVGMITLSVAWLSGVNINGNNSTGDTLNAMTTYLPQMTYSLGYVLLALFLLSVPVYALDFQSLDGKFFPTPTEKKDTDE